MSVSLPWPADSQHMEPLNTRYSLLLLAELVVPDYALPDPAS